MSDDVSQCKVLYQEGAWEKPGDLSEANALAKSTPQYLVSPVNAARFIEVQMREKGAKLRHMGGREGRRVHAGTRTVSCELSFVWCFPHFSVPERVSVLGSVPRATTRSIDRGPLGVPMSCASHTLLSPSLVFSVRARVDDGNRACFYSQTMCVSSYTEFASRAHSFTSIYSCDFCRRYKTVLYTPLSAHPPSRPNRNSYFLVSGFDLTEAGRNDLCTSCTS